jgi:ribulose 1,5-bisphosphate synthetase/thiazole synthase
MTVNPDYLGKGHVRVLDQSELPTNEPVWSVAVEFRVQAKSQEMADGRVVAGLSGAFVVGPERKIRAWRVAR